MSDANTTDPNLERSKEQPPGTPAAKPTDGPSSNDPAAATDAVLAAAEMERLQQELQAANDRALRWQAELDNYRKRARRELDEQSRYAALPLLENILGVVDNLQRAIDAAENSAMENPEQAAGLRAGVKMVAAQMASVLDKHHCQPIEAIGLPFDPHFHEAIAEIPHEKYAAGLVALVARQGYRLYDRVVRPAQVLVSKGAAGPGANNPSASASTRAESPQ